MGTRSTRKHRPLRSAVRIAVVVCAVLFFLFFMNPMLLAFMTDLRIVNDSGETVWVTPVGIPSSACGYATLPRFRYLLLAAIPWASPTEVELDPGEAFEFTYDWDDVQFVGILVGTGNGDLRYLETDFRPGCCWAPHCEEYMIPEMDRIPTAPAEMGELAEKHRIALPTPCSWRDYVGKEVMLHLVKHDRKDRLLEDVIVHGVIDNEDYHQGIFISVTGQEERLKMPHELEEFYRAPSGEYREDLTGTTITDPGLLGSWNVDNTDVHRKHWVWRSRWAGKKIHCRTPDEVRGLWENDAGE